MGLEAEATIRLYDKNIDINGVTITNQYSFGDGLRLNQKTGQDSDGTVNVRTTIEKDLELCGNNLGVKLGQFRHEKKLMKDIVSSDGKNIEGFRLCTDLMGLKFEFTHGKEANGGAITVVDTADNATRSAYSLSGNFESCGKDLKWCIDYDDWSQQLDLGINAGVDEINGEVAIIVPLNKDRKLKYGLRSAAAEGYDVAFAFDDQKADGEKVDCVVCSEVCGTNVEFRYQETATKENRYNIVLKY